MEEIKAGVYIHVPFCVRKCAYCDFYSLPGRADADFDAYTGRLEREIRGEERGIPADTVYFGGGTPSLLGAERLGRILDAVRETFCLTRDAEITLEANPLDLEEPGKLRHAGFNRLSLGVQSAHDDELRLLARRHTFAEAVETVRAAREAGFDNLSLDLMYALPGQSVGAWTESVRAVAALAPEHISCYALHLEEGVPLAARACEQPDDETQLRMYLEMIGTLEQAGYTQYEISNFSKKGRESRHNSKYWLGADYYGFGPGAHSLIHGRRLACEAGLGDYLAGAGRTVIEEAPDFREEYVILRLRMTRGIDPGDYERRFGVSFSPVEKVLRKYEPAGLCACAQNRWRLTPRGMFVSNAILEEILEIL